MKMDRVVAQGLSDHREVDPGGVTSGTKVISQLRE